MVLAVTPVFSWEWDSFVLKVLKSGFFPSYLGAVVIGYYVEFKFSEVVFLRYSEGDGKDPVIKIFEDVGF